MKTFEIRTEDEMRAAEKELKNKGYKKISDCMWAKIYTDGNTEITLTREY